MSQSDRVSGAESSRKLTLSSLATVREALYDVRSKWEDIGIELLDKNETDAIKKEKINIVGDCLTEMLSTYLKRDDPKPSWDSIIAALRAKAVGLPQLAQDLEQKYLSLIITSSRQQNLPEPQVDHQCIDRLEAPRQSPGQVVDLSFPYLDTNKLSTHERKDLIQRLSSDYKNILEKFATLEARICESLYRQNISAERIANCALRLALNKSDDVPTPLPEDKQESLEEAKTIDRIFMLLRKHKLISYFDYGILKHIIEIHGTADDKLELKDYVDEFRKFCQHKVFETPSVISECTSSTRKIFRVLITADMSTTLTDIAAAERKIADILGLDHSMLTLHKITSGSLVLTLSIPIQIADKIFPLQASQLSQLKANGFTILSDKMIMDQPFETKMQGSEEVRDSYDNLVALLASKLSKKQLQNNLDIKSLYLYLSSFFPPNSLPNTDDVHLIFSDINAQRLWGYCQYETIECIANRYLPEDKELSSMIDEHREMVNNYLATQHITDYIEEEPDTESSKMIPTFHGRRSNKSYYDKLSVTVHDASIRMKTLKNVRDLWRKIKCEFHLPDCNALLNHIYEAESIVIVWLVPPSTTEALLTPRAQPWSAIDFLQRERIVRMTLNDDSCIYDIQESKKLLEICTTSRFEEVTSLLKSKDKGVAVNATFEDVLEGKSALMLVCECGHISLVLSVLDGGAEVNFQQKTSGQSALYLAAKFGHLRVVRFLMAYGADPDLMDWSAACAASVARQEGHTNLSDELCKGKSKAKIRTQNPLQYVSDKIEDLTDFILAPGLKLFHRAAKSLVGASRSNHLGSVKYIIDHARNLDINSRESDKHGWTALMWATDNDNLVMVELLLTNKADPNMAAKNNQWTALMLATRQGNLKIVKILLDHGADPNAQNSTGASSMSLAVYEHHTEIAMLLVHRGAEVNIVEEDGNSPLTHACIENDMELVKLFCDYNANKNHQGKKGWTPLMEAARGGFKDIVEELAKRGADLNMRTEAGESAIHAATVKGHVDVVRVLAYYGADLNMPNKDGLTALMVAADKGYQSIVEALLEGGVDVNYKHQATGWPAIFFAAKNGKVNILTKLLERGARTELETGLKLIDVANFFKRKAIVDEIKKKSQQTHPVSPHQHQKPLVQVPGMEAGDVGIELTSFTKKNTPVDKSEEQKRTKSHDILDDKSEPTTDTETGQERSEQLDNSEVGVQDVSQPPVHEPATDSQDPHLPSTATHEVGEEKPVEITDSEFTATKNVDEKEIRDVPKLPDKAPPEQELEELKDQTTVTGEEQTSRESEVEQETKQQEPVPDAQPQRSEDTPTTTQSTPTEGDSQPAQSNQNIAEIAKIYEKLLQAMDERMNVENVKKSRRGKGVSDVERITYSEEIDTRH